ncbi:hypothetical protein PAXRUDRAFT_629474 [Paxillus rubicundulus Ve08.2h10]|uniref:Unplaced genomic scaffold scaffold_562, whole genome shotgun sequence n=1 Tax=Paxillus rubicundulus Ve08.2h10 TaxID=930991 RepID=A0A0D0DY71_9AGAM|nr:hypothetical protein PAXRUDRAFT_249924 [Paxillus rubicundulus Ve08.2h10]KIK91464.1 hypothetical protein PAXRUDRAFT_629474 [Paxillus rubicundulus Ve08.2h10]
MPDGLCHHPCGSTAVSCALQSNIVFGRVKGEANPLYYPEMSLLKMAASLVAPSRTDIYFFSLCSASSCTWTMLASPRSLIDSNCVVFFSPLWARPMSGYEPPRTNYRFVASIIERIEYPHDSTSSASRAAVSRSQVFRSYLLHEIHRTSLITAISST